MAVMRGLVVGMALAGVIASCGGEEKADREGPDAVAAAAQDAFDDGDLRKVCRLLTDRAKTLIAYMAHGGSIDCPQNMERVREWMAKGDRRAIGPVPEVAGVRVTGHRARVSLRQPGSPPYMLRMAKSRGTWKVDGVFDAGTSTFLRRSGVPFDSGPPEVSKPPETATVKALVGGADRHPCPPVSRTGSVELRGGCVLLIPRAPLRTSVLNLFGRMPFSRCKTRLELRVDGSGRVWANRFDGVGDKACGDVRACGYNARNTAHRPWTGRISRLPGGDLTMRFDDVCLDTCVGRFRGGWTVRLQRAAGSWRLRASTAMVGTSGWTFDGSMSAGGGDLRLVASSARR